MPVIEANELFSYQNDSLGLRTLLATASDGSGAQSLSNNVLYWDLNGNPQSIFTPSTKASNVRAVNSRDYLYFYDGVSGDLWKWNYATSKTKTGILPPVSAPTLGAPIATGNITILIGRRYYIVFGNTTDQSYSDVSPISISSGPLTAQNQPLSAIPVSPDPQVNTKIILATADGGDPTTLYEVGSITNATTTFTDTTAEDLLLQANVWQDTDSTGVDHGVFNNTPPPNALYPILHQGRIFLFDGVNIYFSKNLAECLTSTGIIAGRFEECWPADNRLTVSAQAEQIHGSLSDGQTLYIGTEQHIWRVTGDGPANFSQPQVCFNQAGLLSQDTWKVVFLESTPVGTMWLTPDYRVMGSDFNTYENVGTPIQNTLNTINASAAIGPWAMYVELGPYDFYVLAIPTGSNTAPDTFCVFDLHRRKWFIWNFADLFGAGIYYVNLAGTPRWIMSDSFGNIQVLSASYVLDRQGAASQTGIGSTMQTAWLSLGDPALRKVLNEVEIKTDDQALTLTVEGATSQSEFDNTNTVVTAAPMIQSLFGDYKVPLGGDATIDRMYRLTFSSSTLPSPTTGQSISNVSGSNVGSFSISLPEPLNVGDVILIAGAYQVATGGDGFATSLTGIATTSEIIGGNSSFGGVSLVAFTAQQAGQATATVTAPGTGQFWVSILVVSNTSGFPTGLTANGSSSPFSTANYTTVASQSLIIGVAMCLGTGPLATNDTKSMIESTLTTGFSTNIPETLVPAGSIVSSSWQMPGSLGAPFAAILAFTPITVTAQPGDVFLGSYSIEAIPYHRY